LKVTLASRKRHVSVTHKHRLPISRTVRMLVLVSTRLRKKKKTSIQILFHLGSTRRPKQGLKA